MIYISQNKSFFPHHIHQMHLHSPSQCYYPLHHIAKSSHNWHLLHVHEETREKKLKVKCQTCGPIFLGNVWRKKKKKTHGHVEAKFLVKTQFMPICPCSIHTIYMIHTICTYVSYDSLTCPIRIYDTILFVIQYVAYNTYRISYDTNNYGYRNVMNERYTYFLTRKSNF